MDYTLLITCPKCEEGALTINERIDKTMCNNNQCKHEFTIDTYSKDELVPLLLHQINFIIEEIKS